MKETVNVLVVDDTVFTCNGLCQSIQRENFSTKYTFNTVPVYSGEDAVDEIKRTKYQLSIIDYSMPGINGAETCRQILAINPSVKSLGISSYSDIRTVIEFVVAGGNGFIRKEKGDIYCKSLETILEGKDFFDDVILKDLEEFRNKNGIRWYIKGEELKITKRQKEVVMLKFQHFTDHEIADLMNVHITTIYSYITHLLQETFIKNFEELLRALKPYIEKEIAVMNLPKPIHNGLKFQIIK